MENVRNNLDSPWNWEKLSENPNVIMKMVNMYPNKDWNWEALSAHLGDNKYKMANKVVDTTMAFKHLEPFQAGQYEQSLPPHVLENILHHAYNTRDTLSLWETMELIEPILHPTPGITKASRHKNFQDAKK